MGNEETVAIITKWITVTLPGFGNIEKQHFREIMIRMNKQKPQNRNPTLSPNASIILMMKDLLVTHKESVPAGAEM